MPVQSVSQDSCKGGEKENRDLARESHESQQENAESVKRYTSQPMAIRCIQVPIKEMPCPAKKRR